MVKTIKIMRYIVVFLAAFLGSQFSDNFFIDIILGTVFAWGALFICGIGEAILGYEEPEKRVDIDVTISDDGNIDINVSGDDINIKDVNVNKKDHSEDEK